MISSVRTISKNAMYLGIGEIVSKLLLFALMAYAARNLGKETFGLLNFGISFSLIVLLFYDFGYFQLLIREISYKKNMAKDYISSSFLVKCKIIIVILLISMIAMYMFGFSKDALIISLLMSFYAILLSYTQIFYSLFRAFERMYYDMLIKIIKMVVLLVSGIFVIVYYKNIFLLAGCFILSEIVSLIVAITIAIRKFNFRIYDHFIFPRVGKNIISTLHRKNLPFLFSSLFSGVYLYLGILILQRIKGEGAVGVYGAAFYLVFATLLIPAIYISAIYPVLSKYFGNSRSKNILIYERSFKYLYILGLPVSIGTFFLAAPLIRLIYGAGYNESVVVLKIISFIILLKFLNNLTGIVLSAVDKQKEKMHNQGIIASFNLVLNLILIPFFSFIGVAIAALITEIALFLIYYSSVSRHFVRFGIFSVIYKPIIAVSVMSLFLLFFDINIFISIIFGAVIYGSILLLLKTFDERDYSLMQSILKVKI